MRYFNDCNRSEGQPTELSNRGHGPYQGVLSPHKACICLKPEEGTITQDGFVENLLRLEGILLPLEAEY